MMNVDEFTLKCLANRMQLARIHAKNGHKTATEHQDMISCSDRLLQLVTDMLKPIDTCNIAYPAELRDSFHAFGNHAMHYFKRLDEIAQNEQETKEEEEREERDENDY